MQLPLLTLPRSEGPSSSALRCSPAGHVLQWDSVHALQGHVRGDRLDVSAANKEGIFSWPSMQVRVGEKSKELRRFVGVNAMRFGKCNRKPVCLVGL